VDEYNAKDLIHRLSGAFDEYELCCISEKDTIYECRERELYGFEIKEEWGMALRAVKGGRLIFTHTCAAGEEGIDDLIDKGKALLPFVDEDRDLGFPGPFSSYPEADFFDTVGLDRPEREKIDSLAAMEEVILSHDPRIVATRNCELRESRLTMTIANSAGMTAEGRKTLYSLFALAVAKEEEDVSSWNWTWAHRLSEIDFEDFGRKLAGKAVSQLSARQLQTGIYEGILTPRAVCDILEILSGSFLGENLFKKKTKLDGKVGQRSFSKTISIVDSGLRGTGGFPFDGEGVPARENLLVQDGVLRGFLFDSYYGKKLGFDSTGNGIRPGIKDPPKCSAGGFFIEPGPDDIWATYADGIIIDELMGTHTANPITGDFSVGAIGYERRGGEDLPFSGVIFSGNVFDLLQSVERPGNDLVFLGTTGAPSLYARGLKISGT